MGYVFNEIFWWILGALILGFILGWVFWKCRMWLSGSARDADETARLTALADTRQQELDALRVELDQRGEAVATLTSKVQSSDSEVLSLRGRLAELEPYQARVGELQAELAGFAALKSSVSDLEADRAQIPRLNARIADLEAANAELPGLRMRLAELEADAAAAEGMRARIAGLEAEAAEAAELRSRVAGLEAQSIESAVGVPAFDIDTAGDGATSVSALVDLTSTPDVDAEPELDLDAAAVVLGKRIRRDDLTVIEGIGPKIAEIISADGIDTWRSLSLTQPTHIRGLLDLAGSSYSIHDPGTWPEQAGLLADGRWEEFKALAEELDGGVRVSGATGIAGLTGVETEVEPPAPDVDSAIGVLGFRPKLDDLKLIEGIGPAIERLMNDAGISTWRRLSSTEPEVLSTILQEAGPRFRIHDPGTWPQQAELLASGQWQEFVQLTENLKGGRSNA